MTRLPHRKERRQVGRQARRQVRRHKPAIHRLRQGVRRPQRPSRQTSKGQARKGKRMRKPEDPLEDMVTEHVPMPDGYVFVPKGDVYVTRKCRSETKVSEQVVYRVYNEMSTSPIGIRVPSDIYQEALVKSQETAASRASAVQAHETKFLKRVGDVMRNQYPLMPDDMLTAILNHSFRKGSGRVGRHQTLSEMERVRIAVTAHLRHNLTSYDSLLANGTRWAAARRETRGTVKAIRETLEGNRTKNKVSLPLRPR